VPAPTRQQSLFISATPALFVILWATGFVGAKLGLPYAPPLKFLLWRFAVVIALMTPFAFFTGAPWPRGRKIAHVAIAGILLQGGYLAGVFVAISLGLSAGLAALIVGTQPILTAIAGPLIGERVNPRQWAGLGLGFVGVGMVLSNKIGFGGFGWEAVAFAVLALVTITAGTLYQKRFCGGADLRTQSVIQFIAAGAVLLPFSLAFETRAVVWSGALVFAIVWLVVVLSLGATTLLLLLIRRGAATSVTSLMYLVPPVTALIAYVMFDERLTLVALAGMAVAVAGVALVVRK
jgi:drug/metabolite transporter (DMT)-like permease